MGRPHRAAGVTFTSRPSDDHVVTVSAVKCNAAILTGELSGKIMETMIDSGSAVSLVMKQEVDVLKHDRL